MPVFSAEQRIQGLALEIDRVTLGEVPSQLALGSLRGLTSNRFTRFRDSAP